MRLKGFNSFIRDEMLKQHKLKGCTVIVDGTNLAYCLFDGINLSLECGCECDKIANFVQDYLIMFKRANVKCCFMFKGGDSDFKEKIQENKFTEKYTSLLFETFRQSVESMGIDYTICEFAAKMECVAAAQKFNCPLISFDIEYCFSNVAYIPHNTLKYNKLEECIECGLYELKNLYEKFPITKEKLSIIIGLKDVSLFPEKTFDIFFANMQLRAPYNYPKVYSCLLLWLTNTTFDEAINQIFKCDIKYENVTKEKFIEETQRVINVIDCAIQGGIPVQYLYNGNDAQFEKRDIDWFKKGVASNHIPVPYVNLYHSKIIRGLSFTANEEIDPKLFSIDIVKYAYDLLSEFQQDSFEGFTLIKVFDELIKPTAVEEKILREVKSIRKPKYEAVMSVFENGWKEVDRLYLFNHFLTEAAQFVPFDFEYLDSIPDEKKLFIISLVYFSRKKGKLSEKDAENLVFSVILSHVILNNVLDEKNDLVTRGDHVIGAAVLAKYFAKVKTVGKKLLYTLYEYANCLEELNNLNNLCGAPYMNTVYGKVFNGQLIYNIYQDIAHNNDKSGINFVHAILKSCPTVFTCFESLVSTYSAFMK